MADRFLDRVAETAGLTVRRLREHQAVLYRIGLTAEARDLEALIREQEDIVFSCSEITDVGQPKPTRR